ncbi:unnamed protein product [Cylindrotheca closterium]|uniref:PDZ domain-containing protein n=1 Tax=Cylindrotheca closterium TaxID=2856 RepID=A0AAD2CBT3_9STRA|nr:unnamed protein product [Cylindrotheca closterium]
MTQKPKHIVAAGNALISVTVYKSTANQKAGIKVVQKADGVYITAIAKGGLLDGTRVDVGDKLLSINGRRMRQGQDTKDFMKLISTANDKVTIVVKKDKGPTQKTVGKSPGKTKKLVERDVFRTKDGSFDYNINPKLEEFERSISKFDDEYEQCPISVNKLFPEQGAGLVFKKKEDMLFVSGITLDSIFADTELEFGDRIVSVMDVNFMNYADEKYAKTLLKRAKGEVHIVVEKGWNKLEKVERDARHGMPRQDSMVIPKKRGKVTITKDTSAKPMESLKEAEATDIADEDEDQDAVPPAPEEDGENPLVFSPEEPESRKTLVKGKEDESPGAEAPVPIQPEEPTPRKTLALEKEESPSPATVTIDTTEKESPSPMHSYASQSPAKSFTPNRQSPSPANGNKPRKFLPPMPKESKKRPSKTDVDAGDVVSRMLNKLDNERKGIKERHRVRLNQSFDDAAADDNNVSQEVTPEKKTPLRLPVRKYSSPSSNGFSTPSKTGLAKNNLLQNHPGGYLSISVRKKSERSPGIKLRRKDNIFILDRLPHDENRIPLGVQVLAINGDDSFGTVVKANELIDSRKQEVELSVSFEGLIAVRASDDQ